MRSKFNLDLKSLERFSLLLHGNYGVGKTYFLGDVLREESKVGKVQFLNIAGEDGYLSIANLGLGEIGESVETLDDMKLALADYQKSNLQALAIDGFKHYGKLIVKKICGDKVPSVGKGSDDWQRIHQEFESVVATFRQIAPVVVVASSSDRSMDQVSGEITLTPDVPGRQAAGSGGQFDFVFVMKAMAMGPNRIKRTLITAPVSNTVIRSRLPRALPPEIDLPEGGGGWAKLRNAMQECLDKAGEVK